MITGTFSQRRAYVDLTVRGPNGREGTVEFVLDTGFTGALTLPAAACTALNLDAARIQPARLADGSRVVLDVYEAVLIWTGQLPNSSATSRFTREPSTRPFSSAMIGRITLPMPALPCAPVSAMTRRMMARTSSSESSAGR
jgi:clan AA aspartic protease